MSRVVHRSEGSEMSFSRGRVEQAVQTVFVFPAKAGSSRYRLDARDNHQSFQTAFK